MESQTSTWWFVYLVILYCSLLVELVNSNECGVTYTGDLTEETVTTPLGQLIGMKRKVDDFMFIRDLFVHEYLGVPFAKPPIGDLRFKKPVKVEAWDEAKECYCKPKSCVQPTTDPWPWRLNHTVMGEDCLYMNIWAPVDASPENKKSVLFFIPGGGFTNGSGSASDNIYNGRTLSAKGDIIVVVPNYRVGTLGFWSTARYPVYSDSVRAPGNLAIWDIITALEWVADYIENFGGDVQNVTLAGQGFGSVIVSLLSVSYQSKGLFSRLIMQSGSAMWQYNRHLSDNLNISQQIAEKLGCASNTVNLHDNEDEVINCMQTKDAVDLISAEAETSQYYPVYGDDLFDRNPRDDICAHGFTFSELLIGFTGNEGIPILFGHYPEEFGYFGKKDVSDLNYMGRGVLGTILEERFLRYPNFYQMYQPQHSMVYSATGMDWRWVVADAFGDYTVICPTVYYGQKAVLSGAKVYFYHFDYRPSKSVWANWIGVTHFDEMAFVFGVPYTYHNDYSFVERTLTKNIMKHWSDFVKYGTPGLNHWPQFDHNNLSTIRTYVGHSLDNPVARSVGVLKRHCDYWKDKYEEQE